MLSRTWPQAGITFLCRVYLIGSAFEIRFYDATQTSDLTQSTWQVDGVHLHVWSINYELDLEGQWTSASYSETNEELCIRTGTLNAEALKVDVWYSSAWVNVIASLTASAWNNVSVASSSDKLDIHNPFSWRE